MAEDPIYLNGIDGSTGGYLVPPMPAADAARFAEATQPPQPTLKVLSTLARQASEPHLGLSFRLDPLKLDEAGWAIVFHTDEDAAVKKALEPLIEHRRSAIGEFVKVLEYRDGETVASWLARHRVGIGTVDPEKVPLYVLLIGSPERIPFEFGHILDVQYCIGRLHFDSPDDYKRYAQSVIDYETGATVPNSKDVVFFGPRHVNDPPTRLSSDFLVKPLAQADGTTTVLGGVRRKTGVSFTPRYFTPEESTKATLTGIFRPPAGSTSPAFLFTASHGLGWPKGDPLQVPASGALLCQDFRAPGLGPLQPAHYFAASDLPPDARVHGLVCFHFACYGAGTPSHNRFLHAQNMPPPQIADKPFFSALPKALLAHPNGGALGVFGHVERAWMQSITTAGAGPQLVPFENVIGFVLLGCPLGYALKDFNERYAALSTELGSLLERRGFGVPVPDRELADRWTERNDAESYVLFGDPGVRIRIDKLQ